RRSFAASIVQRPLLFERRLQAMSDLVPGALVLWLFLAPDDLARLCIALEDRVVVLDRKWIELLDAYNRDVAQLVRAASLEQIEIDLAAAENDAAHLAGINR